MLIREFGLFWERDKVDWEPGRGKKFELLGHRGENRGTCQVADFRQQTGLYVLYGNYGTYYVGLSEGRLGGRIKDHLSDDHADGWNRFSWFGFRKVLKSTEANGFQRLAGAKDYSAGGTGSVMRDMEALLIKALGLPSNVAHTKFPDGRRWLQVAADDREHYASKVRPK